MTIKAEILSGPDLFHLANGDEVRELDIPSGSRLKASIRDHQVTFRDYGWVSLHGMGAQIELRSDNLETPTVAFDGNIRGVSLSRGVEEYITRAEISTEGETILSFRSADEVSYIKVEHKQ